MHLGIESENNKHIIYAEKLKGLCHGQKSLYLFSDSDA